MKDFILKNKKIVCIVLGGISILFIILAIFNLTGTKRAAYKSMYDASNELYESYIDVAEKFERYGYSSKAQSYYSNAYELEDKLERYKSKMAGLNVKDFWKFIEANQMLDKLYNFSVKYNNLTTQEQVIFLMEAEKVFEAFDKVPDMLWEEEYQKYMEVLDKYKDIKLLRWNQC